MYVGLDFECNQYGTRMIVPLAVVARRMPIMCMLGAVRAALIANHQVGSEVDVSGHATRAEDHVGPLERRVCVHSAIIVSYSVTVRLDVRVHVPLLAVRAEKVRAHRASPAVLVLRILVSVIDDVPISMPIDPHEGVLYMIVRR